MTEVRVEQITLRRQSRVLELRFDAATTHALPFEYLRVNSPSAEVQGHGPGEGVLVIGKEAVQILRVEPVGQYAVRLVFDDGHDSGLYTWKYLHQLATQHEQRWRDYQRRVAQAAQRPHENGTPKKERPG
ncbi:MAG TPA: DUF971 domain-containing protein [Steroidobacteraceae bacterium]|jgi:DUF971 family protein|nr:DUF971 domain-containing protein [Steroidobacteraceae bacterium]